MKKTIINIILFSIPINFIWEMAQMPLYNEMPWNLDTSLFCFVASLGDAIMILVIFFTVAFLLRNKNWIFSLTSLNVIITLTVGFIIAVIVERLALADNMWSYSELMPIIPFNVGLSPILQMLVLPLLVFKLTKNKLLNGRSML